MAQDVGKGGGGVPPRARFAADPARSPPRRRYAEPASAHRTPYARDRDRIIHTSAFRRLKEKTQVFVAHEGDHFRTRLTHSLEVAQIARSLAAALGLDADLAEAIALSHDLGHPPFAHAGEEELVRQMAGFGGFDHNVQTFRLLTELERRYPAFDGLNLTWDTLEGVIKHNGPAADRLTEPSWASVAAFDRDWPLDLAQWPSAEAQVAGIADDIAYNNHDVDDGLQAGLFSLAELEQAPLIGPILRDVGAAHPTLDERMTRLEGVRRLIGAMVEDVLVETARRIERLHPASSAEVRALGEPLVGFSPDLEVDLDSLREFLHARMYRHWRVNRSRSQARRLLAELFALFMSEPELLPPEWSARQEGGGDGGRARVVCDYVAGMTDRFAIEEHRRLFRFDT